MNPNDYQRCWSVSDYVLAQTVSSLTWIAIAGLGGLALMLLRKRIRPFLDKLKGENYGPPIQRLPNGLPRAYVALDLDTEKPRLIVRLTEDMPIEIKGQPDFRIEPKLEGDSVFLRAVRIEKP